MWLAVRLEYWSVYFTSYLMAMFNTANFTRTCDASNLSVDVERGNVLLDLWILEGFVSVINFEFEW